MINIDGSRLAWRKASYSNWDNNCVEIAVAPGGVAIRDSKNPGQPHLTVSPAVFADFLGAIKRG